MKPRYIILFLIVIIGFCSLLFASFYNQAKQETIKHINNEQLLHAMHATRGIEDFFNNWTRTLTALSESSPVIKMDKAGKENIKLLYKSNQERIRAITRVDATGRIIYTFPFNPEAVGRDISNQAHVREIMRTHTPVVSDVFFAVQGYDTIAHTFNNQLGVVIGNLEMAIDDLPHGAGPANRLTTAMQAAWKAAEMSGLMLTYLGQSFDKLEPLDLSDACRRGLPMLRAAMPGKVVLETDLPSPGPVISANENQIQQVLTNLVTNAWEAIGEGRGAIHLSIKTISPAEIPAAYRLPIGWQSQESAYASMEVKDAGCGIADKDIEKLFDPFFSSKFTGRGLGLSVVLGIVKAHSGAVTVESEPNRGSTFRVFLPVSGEEVPRRPDKVGNDGNCGDTLQQGVPTIPSPIVMEGSRTILLVDDEEMVRDMAAAMLKHLGFTVLEAKDGIEAVEVFRQRQNEICLVLCDLTMPRMNGWETLTALRKLAPDIPVILASGYDEAQVMAGDHPEWPQVFLGKPYKLKGLSDAIGQALVNKKK